jgi:hypothetical protein
LVAAVVILLAPVGWADEPSLPTDPQGRIQPPVGVTAQHRIQPPVGDAEQVRIQPPVGVTAQGRLQPPGGVAAAGDSGFMELLMSWIRARVGVTVE